jgi:guanine nucleotide-binding protein subunit alpha
VRKLHEVLKKSSAAAKWASSRNSSQNGHGSDDEPASPGDPVDEATEILASCREDIKTLWSDEEVNVVSGKRKLRLEGTAGLYAFILGSGYARYSPSLSSFLDDIDRIARMDYEPSDEDIYRARLRTVGMQEHRMCFETRLPGALGRPPFIL